MTPPTSHEHQQHLGIYSPAPLAMFVIFEYKLVKGIDRLTLPRRQTQELKILHKMTLLPFVVLSPLVACHHSHTKLPGHVIRSNEFLTCLPCGRTAHPSPSTVGGRGPGGPGGRGGGVSICCLSSSSEH